MAKIANGYNLSDGREVAIGVARGELKRAGICPVKATIRQYWEALDGFAYRSGNEDKIATIYYRAMDGNKSQERQFAADVKKWQREYYWMAQ